MCRRRSVAQLNETSAISRASVASSAPAIGASVAMNDSIVAMSGWIMPAPFAMPVIVTGTSPTVTRRDAPFGTVSVVMIADTAANQPSAASAARAAGSAATIFATGSGSMITPVENGSTCCSPQPSIDATAAQVVSAAAIAGGAGAGVGVARVDDQRADVRAALEVAATDDHRRRAEAVAREHAGRAVPGSNTASSTSSRSQFLTFAAAVPSVTPGTGSRSGWAGCSGRAWSHGQSTRRSGSRRNSARA